MHNRGYSTPPDPIALFRVLVFDAFGIVEMGPGVSLWGRRSGKLFAGGSTRGPLEPAEKVAKWSVLANVSPYFS